MPTSEWLEQEAERLAGELGEAEAMVAALRALVGGPRKDELRVAGKDYCRHCGVEIFVPRMNEQRTGPLMHVALVPYRQCKMLTNAQWEDGHEEPPKPAPKSKVRKINCGRCHENIEPNDKALLDHLNRPDHLDGGNIPLSTVEV